MADEDEDSREALDGSIDRRAEIVALLFRDGRSIHDIADAEPDLEWARLERRSPERMSYIRNDELEGALELVSEVLDAVESGDRDRISRFSAAWRLVSGRSRSVTKCKADYLEAVRRMAAFVKEPQWDPPSAMPMGLARAHVAFHADDERFLNLSDEQVFSALRSLPDNPGGRGRHGPTHLAATWMIELGLFDSPVTDIEEAKKDLERALRSVNQRG